MDRIRSLRRAARSQLRKTGWDVVRFPWPASHAAYLTQLFHDYPFNVVVDVGANSGEFGALARSIGFRGLIISFEPGAAAFERLSAAARGDREWIAVNVALGAADETRTLNVYRDDVLSSFREPVERPDFRVEYGYDLMPSLHESRQETVRLQTLDSALAELSTALPASPRIFLKMDTQGFDLEVFRGTRTVRPQIVALQSELSYQPLYEGMPTAAEALSEFRAAGFAEGEFFTVHHDEHLRAVEMDCVMVRADLHPRPAAY